MVARIIHDLSVHTAAGIPARPRMIPTMRAAAALVLLLAAACATGAPERQGRPADTVGPAPTLPSETTTQPDGLPGPPPDATRHRVTRVVDGDTVVLAGLGVGTTDRRTGGHRARLIGIDTPEVHGTTECYGREASEFAKRQLDGRELLVDLDVQPTDRYGRALVYLWTPDGSFFNARLVAEGYAQQATFPPNVRYVELFTQLAREARHAGRGLWSICTDA